MTRLKLREQRARVKAMELRNRRAEIALREDECRVEASRIVVQEAQSSMFVDRDSAPWFDLLSYATQDAIDQNTHREMQRKAYQAWSLDCFYHGLVEAIVRFVASTRTKLIAVDEDPKTQECLDEYCRDRRMPDGRIEIGFTLRFEEQVRRYVRDGEFFKRRFLNRGDGFIARRFMQPLWVRSRGQGNDSFGVVTNPDDVEHVYGYTYFDGPNDTFFMDRSRAEFVPAMEVLHGKHGDSAAKRGRPYLLPVTQKLLELQQLLRSRLKFHWLSTQFGIQRKVQSGARYADALIERNKATKQNAAGTREKAPGDGNIVTMSPGVEIDIKTASLHAIDAQADVKRIIYQIVQCLGLSYTVGSGDASDSNYNSGTQAENPMLKTMDGIQGRLSPMPELEGQEVLEAKIESGMLPRMSFKREDDTISPNGMDRVKGGTVTVPRNTLVKVEFPRVMERDLVKEANAIAIMDAIGYLSKKTGRVLVDLDPDEEERRLKVQRIEEAEWQQAQEAANGNGMAGRELGARLQTGAKAGNGNGTLARRAFAGA